MTNTIRKFIFRSKRRVKVGGHDGRMWDLQEAGLRLLARFDYDEVSMAQLAKEAGCSVGALYNRFPEKELYLYHLIATQFRTLTREAQLVLNVARWPGASIPDLIKQIVSHLVTSMGSKRAAGAICAAIKLATRQQMAIEPFRDYRNAITECTTALLTPHLGENARRKIRSAMQITLATMTDAILLDEMGPLRIDSNQMIDALTTMMLGYFKIASGQEISKDEEEGGAIDEAEKKTDQRSKPSKRFPATYDPDLRVYERTKSAPAKSAKPHPRHPTTNPLDARPASDAADRAKPTGKRARFKMI